VTAARIEQLVRSVGGPMPLTERSHDWTALYDLLIKPIAAHLPSRPGARLTIVPHGPLMQLPFAALRDRRGRYLVERFTIATVPSVAMLRYTGAPHATEARSGSILLVADPSSMPVIVGEPPLPRLPGAVEETRAIARLVPASRTTWLAQANASEPRVLEAAPHKSVIHFATHAIVRDVDPWSSFLALGVPAGGATDGKLTAQKIYGLSLDADLVVLSACRSGGGVITGDGIASLARAFFYAGASSMIVSVWDVADESAKRLLPAFYRSWLGGADKATALRASQLAMIRDLRAGRVTVATPAGEVPLVEDPALWAGFVLLGNPN
jgi:CHAT domain-containing protein